MLIPVGDIAKDALKPLSNATEPIIAPFAARLRKWAFNFDLEKRVEAVQLNIEGVFERYFERLRDRVSGVRTIVFSPQVLPLSQIYEPLSLVERYKSLVPEEDLRQEGACFYIIDGAGMGKSTFAKHLILKEIENSPFIPIFLELRRISLGQTLIEAIACELDDLGKPFERDVLLELLAKAPFFVVLDGFDEISSSEKDRIARDIEDFARKSPRSAIILTSRPETNLPDLPKVRVLSIASLTSEQAQSLVRRLDLVGQIKVGEQLIRQFDKVPEQFLETPLLVALLYLTFGINGSISVRITTFYSEVYSALYKGHDLTKSSFNREKKSALDFEDFRVLLRGFAFLSIINQDNRFKSASEANAMIRQAIQLTNTKPHSSEAWLEDMLASVPLMIREGGEIRFIHKTIAEYFAAEYIAYCGTGEQILTKILSRPIKSVFSETFRFLSDINEALFRKIIVAPVAKALIELQTYDSPQLRKIAFLGGVYIGLWPQPQHGATPQRRRKSNPFVESLPPLPDRSGRSLMFSHGTVDKEPYTVALTMLSFETEIALSWNWLTDEINDEADEFSSVTGDHPTPEFDDLVPLIGKGKWTKMEDVGASEFVANQNLNNFFDLSVTIHNSTHQGLDIAYRMLSEEKAKNLLETVEAEEENKYWINSLIEGASPRIEIRA